MVTHPWTRLDDTMECHQAQPNAVRQIAVNQAARSLSTTGEELHTYIELYLSIPSVAPALSTHVPARGTPDNCMREHQSRSASTLRGHLDLSYLYFTGWPEGQSGVLRA